MSFAPTPAPGPVLRQKKSTPTSGPTPEKYTL